MIDGPHIFGFSPDALCINFASALASARLRSSVIASMNAATLTSVGLVLFSAILAASPLATKLTVPGARTARRKDVCTGRSSAHATLQAPRQFTCPPFPGGIITHWFRGVPQTYERQQRQQQKCYK